MEARNNLPVPVLAPLMSYSCTTWPTRQGTFNLRLQLLEGLYLAVPSVTLGVKRLSDRIQASMYRLAMAWQLVPQFGGNPEFRRLRPSDIMHDHTMMTMTGTVGPSSRSRSVGVRWPRPQWPWPSRLVLLVLVLLLAMAMLSRGPRKRAPPVSRDRRARATCTMHMAWHGSLSQRLAPWPAPVAMACQAPA